MPHSQSHWRKLLLFVSVAILTGKERHAVAKHAEPVCGASHRCTSASENPRTCAFLTSEPMHTAAEVNSSRDTQCTLRNRPIELAKPDESVVDQSETVLGFGPGECHAWPLNLFDDPLSASCMESNRYAVRSRCDVHMPCAGAAPMAALAFKLQQW